MFSWAIFCPPFRNTYMQDLCRHRDTILLKPRVQAPWQKLRLYATVTLTKPHFFFLTSLQQITNWHCKALCLQIHAFTQETSFLFLIWVIFLPSMAFVVSKLNGKLHKCIRMKFLLSNQCFAKGCEGIIH